MTDKDCRDCVYVSEENCSSGIIRCDYPVPVYIQINANNFQPVIMGRDCQLIKTKDDLMAETIKDES